jgi:hypothetical protein
VLVHTLSWSVSQFPSHRIFIHGHNTFCVVLLIDSFGGGGGGLFMLQNLIIVEETVNFFSSQTCLAIFGHGDSQRSIVTATVLFLVIHTLGVVACNNFNKKCGLFCTC